MISINEKALTVPYCLSRIEFLRQLHAYAKDRMIKGTKYNLSDFKPIIGNKGIQVFKPEMWTAMQLRQENLTTKAAGLLENPPRIIQPIEENPNLPKEPPTMQDQIP